MRPMLTVQRLEDRCLTTALAAMNPIAGLLHGPAGLTGAHSDAAAAFKGLSRNHNLTFVRARRRARVR